jgi:hypothetical protein
MNGEASFRHFDDLRERENLPSKHSPTNLVHKHHFPGTEWCPLYHLASRITGEARTMKDQDPRNL